MPRIDRLVSPTDVSLTGECTEPTEYETRTIAIPDGTILITDQYNEDGDRTGLGFLVRYEGTDKTRPWSWVEAARTALAFSVQAAIPRPVYRYTIKQEPDRDTPWFTQWAAHDPVRRAVTNEETDGFVRFETIMERLRELYADDDRRFEAVQFALRQYTEYLEAQLLSERFLSLDTALDALLDEIQDHYDAETRADVRKRHIENWSEQFETIIEAREKLRYEGNTEAIEGTVQDLRSAVMAAICRVLDIDEQAWIQAPGRPFRAHKEPVIKLTAKVSQYAFPELEAGMAVPRFGGTVELEPVIDEGDFAFELLIDGESTDTLQALGDRFQPVDDELLQHYSRMAGGQ